MALPSIPGLGATLVLLLCCLAVLGWGLARNGASQIIIGATGVFACVVLFTIGLVVARLK